MMPSTVQPHYVASTLAHTPTSALRDVLADFDRVGLYVAMIEAESRGRIHAGPSNPPLISYRLARRDVSRLADAYRRLAELLFAAGAIALYPPIQGALPARSVKDVEAHIAEWSPARLGLVTVHAMSSCAMGAVVDLDGRVNGVDNVYVCDASVLPTNTGESPQGTIMAMSHEILRRHLHRSILDRTWRNSSSS